jgi:hypothetical protein
MGNVDAEYTPDLNAKVASLSNDVPWKRHITFLIIRELSRCWIARLPFAFACSEGAVNEGDIVDDILLTQMLEQWQLWV